MKKKLLIIGAGGHGRVVAEAAVLSDEYDVVGFLDDNVKIGTEINGIRVVGTIAGEVKESGASHFVVALGNNILRKRMFEIFNKKLSPGTIKHPFTSVSSNCFIKSGTVILSGAVIASGTEIGMNVIINSLSLVDHDCVIGDHSHIAQGTVVASNVVLDSLTTTILGDRIKRIL